MVARHLPKKLLCVALIGTSILAVIYYTNGISNLSANKLKQQSNKEDYPSVNQHNKQTNVQNKGLKRRNDKKNDIYDRFWSCGLFIGGKENHSFIKWYLDFKTD